MHGRRRAVAALRREEGGFTLIELLVASAIGLVVVAGAMSVFLSGVKSQPRASSKVAAIQQGRFTVERIVRELRQGLEVPQVASPQAPTSSRLAIVTYVKASYCGGPAASSSIPCRVTYACAGGTCTRSVAQPDGSGAGPAVEVVEGLSSDEVFAYTPSATDASFVGVTLSLESDGEPVVLGDGAALRNPSEES